MAISQTNIFIALLGLGIVAIVELGLIVLLSHKLKKFLRGKNAETLEDSVRSLMEEVDSIHKTIEGGKEKVRHLEEKISRAARSIETVRFNAFKGDNVGGNQSFATSIVTERGDGVVVSSIYSRERVSVFAKPIHNFSSEYELSNEERDVLDKSKKSFTA